MEPIDWEDEFRPLNDESIDYLVRLTADLKEMSTSDRLRHEDRSVTSVAAYQIMRLAAMANAGFALYSDIRTLADNMADELISTNKILRSLQPLEWTGISVAAEEYRLHLLAAEFGDSD